MNESEQTTEGRANGVFVRVEIPESSSGVRIVYTDRDLRAVALMLNDAGCNALEDMVRLARARIDGARRLAVESMEDMYDHAD